MNKFFLSISFFLLFFLCIAVSSANAQCAIVGTNTSGEIVTIAISCDFPVYIKTGNDKANSENYKIQKDTWVATAPKDYAAISSLTDIYFEIHKSDLSAMPVVKQEAITARPELYHVIQ